MKFFSTGLLLLLVLGNLQGSTIPKKRSVEAPNNSLLTNFNGQYERRDPCTNAEVEKGSYAVSHEFHRNSKEDSWSDYTQKCSEIISSFFQAISSLMKFDKGQDGTFNFEINTTISHKNEDPCDDDGIRSKPTIVIQSNGCEKAPSQDVVPVRGRYEESGNDLKTTAGTSQGKMQCICQPQDNRDSSIPRLNLPSPLLQPIQQQPYDNRQLQEVQNQPSTLTPDCASSTPSQLNQSPLVVPQTEYLPVEASLAPEIPAPALVIPQQTSLENGFAPEIQGGNYNSAIPSQINLPPTVSRQDQPVVVQTQTQLTESNQVSNTVFNPIQSDTSYDQPQIQSIPPTLPPESQSQQTMTPVPSPQTIGESQMISDDTQKVIPNEYQPPQPQPIESLPETSSYETTTIPPMQQSEPQPLTPPAITDSQASESAPLPQQESLPVYPNQFPPANLQPNFQPMNGPYDGRLSQGLQRQGDPSRFGNFYQPAYPQYYPPQSRGTTPYPDTYRATGIPEALMRGPEGAMPVQYRPTPNGVYPPQGFGNDNQFSSNRPPVPQNQPLNNFAPSPVESLPYASRDEPPSTLPPLYQESGPASDSGNPQDLALNQQPSSDFSSSVSNEGFDQMITDSPVSNVPIDQASQADTVYPKPGSPQIAKDSQSPLTSDSPVGESSLVSDQMSQSRVSIPDSPPLIDNQQQQPLNLEPTTIQPSSLDTQNSFPVEQPQTPPFYSDQSSPQGLSSDSLISVNRGYPQPSMGNPLTSQSPPEPATTFNQFPTTQFNNYPPFGQQPPVEWRPEIQPQGPVSYSSEAPNDYVLSPAPEQSPVSRIGSTIDSQQSSDSTPDDSLRPININDDQAPLTFESQNQPLSQTSATTVPENVPSAFMLEPQLPNIESGSSPLIPSDNSTVALSNDPVFVSSPQDASEPVQPPMETFSRPSLLPFEQNQFPSMTGLSPQPTGFLPNKAQPEFSQPLNQFPSNQMNSGANPQMAQPSINYQSTPTPEQAVYEPVFQYSSENNEVPPSDSIVTTIIPEEQPPSVNIPQAQPEDLSSDSYQMASTPVPESQLQNPIALDKQLIPPTEGLPIPSLETNNFQPSQQQQPNSVLYPEQFSPPVETTTVPPKMMSPFLQDSTLSSSERENASDGNQSPPAESVNSQSPSYVPALSEQQPNFSFAPDESSIQPQPQNVDNQQMPINGLSVPQYQNKPSVAQPIEGEQAGSFPFGGPTPQQPTTLSPNYLTLRQTPNVQPNIPGELQFDPSIANSGQGFPEVRQTPQSFTTATQPPVPFFSEQPPNNLEAPNDQKNIGSFAPQPETQSPLPYSNNLNQNRPVAFPVSPVTYPGQIQNAPEPQQPPVLNYGQFNAVNPGEPVSKFNPEFENPVLYYPTIAPRTRIIDNVTYETETNIPQRQPSFPYEQQSADSLFTPQPSYSKNPEPTAMPSFDDQPRLSTSGLPDQDSSSALTTPLPYFGPRDATAVEFETEPQIREQNYPNPEMTSTLSTPQPVNNDDFIKNSEESLQETAPESRSTDDSFITPSPQQEEGTGETPNTQPSYPQEPFNVNPDTSLSQQQVNPLLPPSPEFQSTSLAPWSNAFPGFDPRLPPQPSFLNSAQNRFPQYPVSPVGNTQDQRIPLTFSNNYPTQNENSSGQRIVPNEYQPPQPQPIESLPVTSSYETTTIPPMQQTEPQPLTPPAITDSQASESAPLPQQESLPVYPNNSTIPPQFHQFPSAYFQPNFQPMNGPYDGRYAQGPQQQNGFRGDPSRFGNFYQPAYPQYYPPQSRGTTPYPDTYRATGIPEALMRRPEGGEMPVQYRPTPNGVYPPQGFGNDNQFSSNRPPVLQNQPLNNFAPSPVESMPYASQDQLPSTPSVYNAENSGSSQPLDFKQEPDYLGSPPNDNMNRMIADDPVSNYPMNFGPQRSLASTVAPEVQTQSQTVEDSTSTIPPNEENLSTNGPPASPNYFPTTFPPESEVESSVTESDLVKEDSQSLLTSDSPVDESSPGSDQMPQSRAAVPNSTPLTDNQQQQPLSLEPATTQPPSLDTPDSFPVEQPQSPPFYSDQSSPQRLSSDSLISMNRGYPQPWMSNPAVPQPQPNFVPPQSQPRPYSPFNRNFGEQMSTIRPTPYDTQPGYPGIPPQMRQPGPNAFQPAPNQMFPPLGNYPFRGPSESEIQPTPFQQQQPLGFTPYPPANELPTSSPSYPQPQAFSATTPFPNEQDQSSQSPASLETPRFFPNNQESSTQQPQPEYNQDMLIQPQSSTSPEFQSQPPSPYTDQVPQPQVDLTPSSDVGVNDQRNLESFSPPNAPLPSVLPYPTQGTDMPPPDNQPSGYFNQGPPNKLFSAVNQGPYPPFFHFPDHSTDNGNRGSTHTSSIVFVGKTPSKTETSPEGTPFIAYAHVISTLPNKDEQSKNDESANPGQDALDQQTTFVPDQPEPTPSRQPQMDSPQGLSDDPTRPPQAYQAFPVQGFPAGDQPPFDQQPPSPTPAPNESFTFAPQNQEPFSGAPISSYPQTESEPNFKESQPNAGVSVDQGATSNPQPDSYALVPDITTPSNIPGENNVSCSGQDGERLSPGPLLCPFNPDLKGNMTVPSYYILVSRLPTDDGEERFQVEKVYLGDGTPLNCQTYEGKSFPTASYTEVPFSATAPVSLRIKHDIP